MPETEPTETAPGSLGLARGLLEPGKAVYEALVQPGMDFADLSLCEEAGRLRDRLDRLQKIISGDEEDWARIVKTSGETLVLRIDGALLEARQLTTVYRQLIGDIKRRWPDVFSGADVDGLEGLGELAYPDG